MMAKGQEVAVDSSTESGDTCDAERYSVAASVKVIASSEDDTYDAEHYRVALSGKVIAPSAKVIASSGGDDEAPTSKVEVKKRGKQKAAWPVSKDSAVPTPKSRKDPAVSAAQSSSRESGNCYRIDYYCTKCDAKNEVGPLTLQQQLTGEPPYSKCPLCAAAPGAPDQQPQKT